MSILPRRGGRLGERSPAFVLVVCLLLLATLAGAAMPWVGQSLGALRFGVALAITMATALSLVSLRLALAALVLSLAYPYRTALDPDIALHTTHLQLAIVAIHLGIGLSLKRLRVPRALLAPALVVFAGSLVATVAGPALGLDALLRLALNLALALIAACAIAAEFRPERDLRPLVVLMAVSMAGVSLLGLLQQSGAAPPALLPLNPGRADGTFTHPNLLGGYLAATILILVGVTSGARRSFRLAPLVCLPAIVLGAAALVATLSRGALFGLLAGLLAMFAVSVAGRRGLPLLRMVVLSGVALAISVALIPSSVSTALSERLEQAGTPAARGDRDLIYTEAVRTLRDYPLTGVGFFAFARVAEQRASVGGLETNFGHAHNIVLEGYLSLGPIGLLAVLWLGVGAVRRLLAAERSSDSLVRGYALGAVGALTSIVTQGMADVHFQEVESLTFFVGILASAYAIERARGEGGAPG